MLSQKRFLLTFTLVSILTCAFLAGFNAYLDVYGLFTGKKDRIVHINERTSKYLFSYRYIPENFDGFIMGPSLSANLNPEVLKGFKVYNASIMGGNISELDYLVNNITRKGKMKFAVVCLDPYLTKDFGRKSANIDPKEYWGALGSTNLCKTYLIWCIRKFNLLPSKYAKNIYNSSGWNNFELEMKNLNSEKAILEKIKSKAPEKTDIHPLAFEQLGKSLQTLRKSNVKVIGYFSPVPYELRKIGDKGYDKFEAQISSLFTKQDVLLNLNEEKYKDITSDYHTFIDHGHLSAAGQTFVLGEIQKALDLKKDLIVNKD